MGVEHGKVLYLEAYIPDNRFHRREPVGNVPAQPQLTAEEKKRLEDIVSKGGTPGTVSPAGAYCIATE
jgi:hypothetical protein